MERRKVVCRVVSLQLLKPNGEPNRYHKYGRKVTIHGLVDLRENGKFDLEIPSEIKEQMDEYRVERDIKKRIQKGKKILSEKVNEETYLTNGSRFKF